MKFEIISQAEGRVCSLYTLRAIDSSESEFELAIKEWANTSSPEKIRRFLRIISQSVDISGFHSIDFTPESDTGKEEIYRFNNTGQFRFYLLFLNGMNILVPGGKIKNTRSWQEDPGLKKYITILKEINCIINDYNIPHGYLTQIEIDINERGVITNKTEIIKNYENQL